MNYLVDDVKDLVVALGRQYCRLEVKQERESEIDDDLRRTAEHLVPDP